MTTATKISARDRLVKQHADMAAKAFAEHQIIERLNQGMFRSWRCKRPDSWCYGFDVTTMPGSLVLTGDIGTLVVERTEDMIVWCRGAVNDISYFAEKVPREIPTEEFDPDVAREFIAESVAYEKESDSPSDDRLEKWNDLIELLGDECNEHQFYIDLSESGLVDGCDFPRLTNYRSRFLWQREALKWFLGNLTSDRVQGEMKEPEEQGWRISQNESAV